MGYPRNGMWLKSVVQPDARWLIGLAVLVLWAASLQAGSINELSTAITVGGQSILVERFEPKPPGKYPAVLILHGSDGLTKHGDALRDGGRQLAAKGYVALLVHYFDRTGTKEANEKMIREHCLRWLAVVSEAVDYAGKQDNIDSKRIGLLGFSLGAYLAVAVAIIKEEPRIAAVVANYGGLPKILTAKVEKMPAVLILHGEADQTVPVQEARSFEQLLKDHHRPHEVVIYKDEGHIFQKKAVQEDAARRTLGFFNKYLKFEFGLR